MTGAATPAELDPDRAWSGFRRHHAFIVGIDNYRNVAPLRTAVNDADRLARQLRDEHQFEVHGPLLDATGAQMREWLDVTMKREVGANDRVLFYFAGHGVAADGDDGPAGYLVPADAEKTDLATYIPMAALQAALDALPCKHLLLILDCCFSGAFKWSTSHRAITGLMPKRIYAQRFARFVDDSARQIITSAAYDQKALDVLNGQAAGDRGAKPAKDGRLHSPFALALFDALAGEADVRVGQEGDGVITATEIYSFIRDRIEPATIKEGANLRQTPSFFPLKGHDKGEFMFRNPRHRFNMPPMQGRSPFKGLASFDENDQHLFYGRDRVVADLAKLAADETQRLLVVVGPSGTGKSSVVKAGLLPVLKEAGLAVVVMRPGAHPLAELDKVLQGTHGRRALIVDQFEELITRCGDEAERRDFDARLRELLDAHDTVERIVLTVRSDFEPQLNGGALKDAWRSGRFSVPPFSLEELREVIVMPTIQEVMIFEPPSLVDQIIGEVVQSPGALPLLSYTLNELFQAYVRRGGDKRDLTLADYEQLGGVMGALRTKADALYNNLASDEERNIMRKVMLRMVSVEGDLAGRRAATHELVYPGSEQVLVSKVVEQLIESRLVVRTDDGIEPAHDALVRAWKTLRDWVHDAGRDNLIIGRQLEIAADDHARTGHADYLWNNNPNLPAMRALLKEPRRCWFNAREIGFIEASVRLKTRRLRIAVATAASLFAIVTALMIWGWVEQDRATNSIQAAGTFTDDMLTDMMSKLRVVERTQEARKHLVSGVRRLHVTLNTKGGAEQDQNTNFWTHLLEGEADLDNERYPEALALYQKATAVAEKQLQQQADSATWLRNLSIAYGQLGELGKKREDFDEARRHYRRALDIDNQLAAGPGGDRLALRDAFISHFRLAELERSHRKSDPLKLGEPFQTERRRETHQHFEAAHRLAERLTTQYADDPEVKRDYAMAIVELGNASMDLAETATDETALRALDEFKRAVGWAQRWPDEVLRHADTKPYLEIAYAQFGFLLSKNQLPAEAREALQGGLTLSFYPGKPGEASKTAPTQEQQAIRYTSYVTLGEVETAEHKLPAAGSAFKFALDIADQEIALGRDAEAWTQRADVAARRLNETKAASAQGRNKGTAITRSPKAAAAPR